MTFIQNLLTTLFHSDNEKHVLVLMASLIVWLSAYTGILPAPLDHYKSYIDTLAKVIAALGLLSIDPKPEKK